jgi:drug/metabolite transporter (DMT)-like permease
MSGSPAATAAPAGLSSAGRAQDNVPRGMLWMIAATLLLSLSNAASKYLVARYPVGEVMFFRSASSLIFACALILPTAGLGIFATQRPLDHVGRGLSQAVSQTFTVLALGLMPIAGVMAIGFSAPLWAALVAILWFKEKATRTRWSVLLIGFVGVLIVTHPGADSLQLGALFALANAVMYGSVTVAVRGMTKTESANTLLMWQMAVMTGAHVFLLGFGFTTPTPADAAMMAISGVANAAAQYAWTRALAQAPATAVSPLYYLMLVWGAALGFVFWGEVPTSELFLGSLIVIGAGLVLIWHEARLRRAQMAAVPPVEGEPAARARVEPGARAQAAKVRPGRHCAENSAIFSMGTGRLNR